MPLPNWLVAVAALVAAALAGYGIGFLIGRALSATLARSPQRLRRYEEVFARAVTPGIGLLVAALAYRAVLVLVDDRLTPDGRTWAGGVAVAAFILVPAWMCARLVTQVLQLRVQRDPRFAGAAGVVRTLVTVAIYAIAATMLLGSLGIEVTPIVAGLGITGIALALALQDSLSNLFSGLWMRTTRDLRPGHYIRIEDAKAEGHIVSIGWRTTRMRVATNNLVVIPNSYLARTVYTNFHLPDSRSVASLPVTFSYASDPDAATRLLLEAAAAAQQLPGVLAQPEPKVELALRETGIELTLQFSLRDPTARGPALDLVQRHVLRGARAAGLELAHRPPK